MALSPRGNGLHSWITGEARTKLTTFCRFSNMPAERRRRSCALPIAWTFTCRSTTHAKM